MGSMHCGPSKPSTSRHVFSPARVTVQVAARLPWCETSNLCSPTAVVGQRRKIPTAHAQAGHRRCVQCFASTVALYPALSTQYSVSSPSGFLLADTAIKRGKAFFGSASIVALLSGSVASIRPDAHINTYRFSLGSYLQASKAATVQGVCRIFVGLFAVVATSKPLVSSCTVQLTPTRHSVWCTEPTARVCTL